MASTVGQIFHWPRSVRQTIATQWYVHPVRIHTSLYQASKKHKKHKGSAWIQESSATRINPPSCSRSISSCGVLKPYCFLGLVLSSQAMWSSSSWSYTFKFSPLGENCRSNPLVFSPLPRCQGVFRSAKYIFRLRFFDISGCCAISAPRSYVIDKRKKSGTFTIEDSKPSRTC